MTDVIDQVHLNHWQNRPIRQISLHTTYKYVSYTKYSKVRMCKQRSCDMYLDVCYLKQSTCMITEVNRPLHFICMMKICMLPCGYWGSPWSRDKEFCLSSLVRDTWVRIQDWAGSSDISRNIVCHATWVAKVPNKCPRLVHQRLYGHCLWDVLPYLCDGALKSLTSRTIVTLQKG